MDKQLQQDPPKEKKKRKRIKGQPVLVAKWKDEPEVKVEETETQLKK